MSSVNFEKFFNDFFIINKIFVRVRKPFIFFFVRFSLREMSFVLKKLENSKQPPQRKAVLSSRVGETTCFDKTFIFPHRTHSKFYRRVDAVELIDLESDLKWSPVMT